MKRDITLDDVCEYLKDNSVIIHIPDNEAKDLLQGIADNDSELLLLSSNVSHLNPGADVFIYIAYPDDDYHIISSSTAVKMFGESSTNQMLITLQDIISKTEEYFDEYEIEDEEDVDVDVDVGHWTGIAKSFGLDEYKHQHQKIDYGDLAYTLPYSSKLQVASNSQPKTLKHMLNKFKQK